MEYINETAIENEVIILQRINNNSWYPTLYNEEEQWKRSEINIAINRSSKYGLVDKDVNIIIPFEYDNISLLTLGLFQLSKSGKLGFCDFYRTEDNHPFLIRNKTDCLYDTLTVFYDSYIIMYKKDEKGQVSSHIYFRLAKSISGEGEYASAIDIELVALHKGGKTIIYNANNGKKLTILDYDMSACRSYQSEYGIILLAESAKDLSKTNILLFDTELNSWYEVTESDKYDPFCYSIIGTHYSIIVDANIESIFPIYDIRAGECDRKIISGFIIHSGTSFTVHDGKLEKKGKVDADSIEMFMQVLTDKSTSLETEMSASEPEDLFD